VIIKEETPSLSKNYAIIHHVPTHSESLPSSSNQPPFPERLVVEKVDPTPEYNLASE